MFEDEPDEHLVAISAVLGKLPEPLWSETWTDRRNYFKDEADERGRVVVADSNVTIEGRPVSLLDAVDPREGPLYHLNKHHLEEMPEGEAEIFTDLLAGLLRFCPTERISPKEALEHDWFKFSGYPAAVMAGGWASGAAQTVGPLQGLACTHFDTNRIRLDLSQT